jgi:hypothetical protein
MKVDGIKRIWANPFYLRFKKHFCPICNELLSPIKVSNVVNSESKEAKEFDFALSDGYMIGNIKFIWNEFSCKTCNKNYSVNEIKKTEKRE